MWAMWLWKKITEVYSSQFLHCFMRVRLEYNLEVYSEQWISSQYKIGNDLEYQCVLNKY